MHTCLAAYLHVKNARRIKCFAFFLREMRREEAMLRGVTPLSNAGAPSQAAPCAAVVTVPTRPPAAGLTQEVYACLIPTHDPNLLYIMRHAANPNSANGHNSRPDSTTVQQWCRVIEFATTSTQRSSSGRDTPLTRVPATLVFIHHPTSTLCQPTNTRKNTFVS